MILLLSVVALENHYYLWCSGCLNYASLIRNLKETYRDYRDFKLFQPNGENYYYVLVVDYILRTL